ncbi:hypothetical protein J3D55_004329 [Chryseobacterium ginsenosidimutans]|uniref:hypothetical protein n=1 Tax=Chryseobacterium ginsenosidimutans TaxID=687846 RepID=UPI0021679A5E|nr:hypothetical protein [Chryseobacterium ginsenosidimutans]MCS3871413.1 hypothetical protein [Chryseobacterium ginsenosidimutans]
MKNVLVKSLVVFVVMTLLNAQFTVWSLHFLKEASGEIAMVSDCYFFNMFIGFNNWFYHHFGF